MNTIKKAGLLKIELEEGERGVRKRLYATTKGYWEDIGLKEEFNEKEIEEIDEFFFYPEVIETLFRKEQGKNKANFSAVILKSFFLNQDVAEKLMKKDRKFTQLLMKLGKIVNKHKKAFMKL